MNNLFIQVILLGYIIAVTSGNNSTGISLFNDIPDIFGTIFRPPPGTNQDRGLGFKSKSKAPKAKVTFPWAPNPDRTRPAYTDSMRSYESPDEDALGDDYYDDYDFEFAKSGLKNDNFEKKRNAYARKIINRNML
ncbi:unnamed protein product [Orchesella dallaii]|uniref:Uncharacterized protein n=1 Tax=Orchesella dallaii TaxID=48710 RepID=A0ABP1RE76_9HEXA